MAQPVHPHACGEITATAIEVQGYAGPPPRVWGNPCRSPAAWMQYRSTPTRVGKSQRHIRIPLPPPVHPHACGGNPHHLQRHPRRSRSTPTRVGKSAPAVWPAPPASVHPHACGEIPSKVTQRTPIPLVTLAQLGSCVFVRGREACRFRRMPPSVGAAAGSAGSRINWRPS